jgi:hypothetical protein
MLRAAFNRSKADKGFRETRGSIRAVKRGNVEKAKRPRATEDSWMAWKKLHQWKARRSPRRARRSAVLPLAPGMPGGAAPRLRTKRTNPRKRQEKKSLPATMARGDRDKREPKSPAAPKRRTARWSSR